MSRYLLIDIGAGTMDVLFYDDQEHVHYKAVVESPVRYLARQAARLRGNLLVTGAEMGGGPISAFIKQRALEAKLVMSASAAMTVHHDPERVRSLGLEVVDEDRIDALRASGDYRELELSDLDTGRLRRIVEGFGVPFAFDTVGICVQDHGVPPAGMSHLDYRHQLFKQVLDQSPWPYALVYRADEVPATMNRLRSVAAAGVSLPTDEVYVMDSGMAAIMGASLEPRAAARPAAVVLDVATSHTVGAAVEGQKIAGFFEYHTQDVTLPRLEALIQDLAAGKIDHAQILREGGHGAYLRKAVGAEAVHRIIATGPKRRLAAASKLPIVWGAPLGDNMMTGTVGLLEAIRRRKGLDPEAYL